MHGAAADEGNGIAGRTTWQEAENDNTVTAPVPTRPGPTQLQSASTQSSMGCRYHLCSDPLGFCLCRLCHGCFFSANCGLERIVDPAHESGFECAQPSLKRAPDRRSADSPQ